MKRATSLALLFVAVLAFAAGPMSTDAWAQCPSGACSASADGCNTCCDPCSNCCDPTFGQWYRSAYNWNIVWPKPFIPPARNSVLAMYDAITCKGWQRQNLLGKHHFNEETNMLTQAGKLKVQWILTQTPTDRRDIFVQRGMTAEQTAERIESIRTFAGNMFPAPGHTNVTDTHLVAEGHPASMVDTVFTGYRDNQLPPVLPPDSGSSSSSGE